MSKTDCPRVGEPLPFATLREWAGLSESETVRQVVSPSQVAELPPGVASGLHLLAVGRIRAAESALLFAHAAAEALSLAILSEDKPDRIGALTGLVTAAAAVVADARESQKRHPREEPGPWPIAVKARLIDDLEVALAAIADQETS